MGWETEDGPAPWLADWGLVECEVPGYAARTERNAREGDATLWFGETSSSGARTTLDAVRRFGTGLVIIYPGGLIKPSEIAEYLRRPSLKTVNIAGNRESRAPGIGARVERFLAEVFRQLGHVGG